MDTPEAKIRSLETTVERLSLKIDAICEALKINLQYNPHSYDAFQNEEATEGE